MFGSIVRLPVEIKTTNCTLSFNHIARYCVLKWHLRTKSRIKYKSVGCRVGGGVRETE